MNTENASKGPKGSTDLTPLSQVIKRVRSLTEKPSVRKAFLSIFDQGLVSGTGFATSIIIGRMGSKEELGLYYLALGVVMMLDGVQIELTASPYTVYSQRRSNLSRRIYAGSTLSHHFGFLFLMPFMLGAVAVAVWNGMGPQSLLPVIGVLFVTAPLMLLRSFVREISFSILDVRSAITLDIIMGVVQVLGLFLLAYFGLLGAMPAYVVIGIGCAIGLVYWFLSFRDLFVIRISHIWLHWRRNWIFGRWALATHLIHSTTPFIVPWLVAFYFDEGEAGILAACVALVGLSKLFAIGISNFLTPKSAQVYAQEGAAALRRVIHQVMMVFASTLGAIFVALIFIGDFLASLLYGPAFVGNGLLISFLAASSISGSLGQAAGNGLWAIDQARANFLADICSFVTVFGSALWLVPEYGALGAGASMLMGSVISASVRYTTFLRLTQKLLPATGAPAGVG